jgi:hypothetical protein
VEAKLCSGLRRAALLSFSTATKQPFHTNPVIGLAELCVKSSIDPQLASPRTCRTYRQVDFKPAYDPSSAIRTAAHHQIDPCEKWRLVERKLKTAEDLYDFMVEQFNQSRAFFLEAIVVLILLIELFYFFRGRAM